MWRTLEMSDVLLLLVDARHPFFHFPVSLYRHIVDDFKKPVVLVMNKVCIRVELCMRVLFFFDTLVGNWFGGWMALVRLFEIGSYVVVVCVCI